ncbi:hypothetical protein [Glycomyces albidus]|uniref:Uncharacterized protein n=1 Tax=Glycomyces albidus TaxID=2656774 RepID=A0A6L5G7Y6_9ACTN|nr:hypothetical protein [Glycomyces albidus]MQM25731.1 hypothetical protein [Glycomyces albidus]
MPTYEEALAANPAAFVDYAAEMTAAGTDLAEHRTEYDSTVIAINAGWKDEANAAFNADAAVVDGHVEQVASQVGETAEMLDAGGTAMQSMVEQLKVLDASYRGAGFNVRPEPKVELGAVHWAAIAAAGPFGPMLQALFQARADEGTAQLQLGLSLLTATDAATGAGLTGAAAALEPLEDKGGETDTDTDANAERVARTADRDGDGPGDTPGEDDPGKKRDDGEDEQDRKDEDDKDKDGKDQDEQDRDEDPKAEDEQDRGEPQQEPPQDPQQEPEGPGAEAPGFEEPQIPGQEPPGPGDYTGPEIPEFESEWDPAELGAGAELPSGGLAGGGGIGGGGVGGGGSLDPVPTGGGSGGTPVGLVGTATGAAGAPATGGTGPRSGVGGLVGAPGARGPVNPDDEYERESFLTEDPEEDVWGIGTDENNPYVDFHQEQEQQAEEAPAPPSFEEPTFTLPGFDLPDPPEPTLGRS